MGVQTQLHTILVLVLDGSESTSCCGIFTTGKGEPDTHWKGAWLGPKELRSDKLYNHAKSGHKSLMHYNTITCCGRLVTRPQTEKWRTMNKRVLQAVLYVVYCFRDNVLQLTKWASRTVKLS
jgi:hypothetical protein